MTLMYSWGYSRKALPSYFCLFSVRINDAAEFKNHKIQVASCLISLKVEPSPALSSNLFGGPLIKIVLTHMLVRPAHEMSHFPFLSFHSRFCAFLWERHSGKLKCPSCSQQWLLGVGHLPYQKKEFHSMSAAMATQPPLLKSISSIFGTILCKMSCSWVPQQPALVSLASWHMWPPETKLTVGWTF